MKISPVVHFEMPADDRKRMSKFYTKAFGWQTNQLGSEMGEYVLVTTAETDENRMIKKSGAINGGFFQKTKPDQLTKICNNFNYRGQPVFFNKPLSFKEHALR